MKALTTVQFLAAPHVLVTRCMIFFRLALSTLLVAVAVRERAEVLLAANTIEGDRQ